MLTKLKEKSMKFDSLIIQYSAPSICGIKPSNLFSVSKADFCKREFQKWRQRLIQEGLESFFIELKEKRVLVFIYNPYQIDSMLSEKSVQKYLKSKGYDLSEGTAFFSELKMRLQKSLCGYSDKAGFPHEIGILLGYPLEDVVAFEKCSGKNCKYCGTWKCYSDEKKARLCENKFRECSLLCSKWFEEGFSLTQIIQKYKQAALAA